MDALHFSAESVTGLIVEAVLMMLIPVALLVAWKIRTREKLLPVFVGAGIWFVFAILLKIAPAYFLLQADNPAANTVKNNVWLSYLTAGVLAGVFEETGRFIAFRFLLKKQTHRRASVSYGIGHGGFESAYTGFQLGSVAVLLILINSGLGDLITGGADEATLSLLASQLEPYMNLDFGTCMLGAFERVPAIALHISLSVLVFAAVRERGRLWLFPAAAALHALFDFSIAFYGAQLVPAWAMELILALAAVLIALAARRVYKGLRETEENDRETSVSP